MAALDLSTVRKDISQVNEGLRVISDENPRLETELKRENAILRNKFRILKKDRDFHFRNRKKYKRQLDQLRKKYDELQNNFVSPQFLKDLDESHKEISHLKEIISNREQESSQNLQVNEPFVNDELTELQTANVSIEQHEEEQIAISKPQYVEVEEQDNIQVDEPFVNASIEEHEEQIVRDELQEREAEEEEALHPYDNSSEHEVNADEVEKQVEILNVPSVCRKLRIHLCRIRPELYLQNGNSDCSKSNLVCRWIHHKKGVCRKEFHHASELESHFKTFHVITAKRTSYRCRWEDCPSNGRPFEVPEKFISHLDEHIPELSNETQINQIHNATATEPNSPSENLRRGSRRRGLEARLDKQGRKRPYDSLDGNQFALRGRKKTYNCSFEGCRESFSSKHEFKGHMYSHSGENPFPCPFERCSRRFNNRRQLKIHEGTHKRKNVFPCSYEGCDWKFASKIRLESHMNGHRGKKPFKCPYVGCHWAFANKGLLKSHLRTHTGERPYKCTFKGCGRRFAAKNSLQVHWRIHNDERPYKCTFPDCERRFRQKSNQLEHLRVHTKK